MAFHAVDCPPSDNKDRLIADGRRGGHNGHTYEHDSLLLLKVLVLPVPFGL